MPNQKPNPLNEVLNQLKTEKQILTLEQTTPINILNQSITIQAIIEIHNFTKFKKWFKTQIETETLKLNLNDPVEQLTKTIKSFLKKQIQNYQLLRYPEVGLTVNDQSFKLTALPSSEFKPTKMAEILTVEQKNIKKAVKSLQNNSDKFNVNQFINCPISNQILTVMANYQITAPRNFTNFIENHYDNLHLKQFAQDENKTDEITDSLINQTNDFCIHNPILDDKKIGVTLNDKPQLKFINI